MEFANMIPADLTPSELAQKMEARWELLESMFQRIFDSIEDAKVLTPCFTFIHAKTKRSELQVCLENRCDMQERRFELVENAVQQIQVTILFFFHACYNQYWYFRYAWKIAARCRSAGSS
jgi:hypothetical protein